ncbi:MAG: 1-acyl-sn-glycerol-3-phosphate acyltransferase [Flammeovirgaceae bacterium]|jgi:1-acyl-sn-glycerol-3-phosphate acyltransferase|nr:1-acyl-sn-glycerol-3-phosphate acyltransferase [Flammeovirgaceae bacterium]|tara:strand:+ start:2945 stop:3499 length:555 start_codon:yes stop_codon:yes gene_type:complete
MNELNRLFFKCCFWAFGWKVVGRLPELKKYMITVAPHTSNWDFIVGLAAKYIIRLKAQFLGKDSLFKIPFLGAFMRSIGGHSVDRSKKSKVVEEIAALFHQNDEFVMVIAPEGTRSYQANWRTGFYYIALAAKVPIVMVGIDFAKKTVEINEPFTPCGDAIKDIEMMKNHYRTFSGKNKDQGIR